jgi:hypothetical protein
VLAWCLRTYSCRFSGAEFSGTVVVVAPDSLVPLPLVKPNPKPETLSVLWCRLLNQRTEELVSLGWLCGASARALTLENHDNISRAGGYLYALCLNILLMGATLPLSCLWLSDELGTAKSKNVTLMQVLFNGNANLSWSLTT